MTTRHCRTIDLTALRTSFTAAIEAGQFLGEAIRVNPWLADTWSPPCALIGTFTLTFDDDTYDGLTTVSVGVRLVVPVPALRPAQMDLDAFLTAYLDALQADRELGGSVLMAKPVTATPVLTTRGNQDLPSYDTDNVIVL